MRGANLIFTPAKTRFEQDGGLSEIQTPLTVITADTVESIFTCARSKEIAAVFVSAVKLNEDHTTNGLAANDSKAFVIADALGADDPGTLSRGDKFIRAFCHELAHCLRRDDKEYTDSGAKLRLLLYFTTDNGTELTADDIEKINPALPR